jgi:hypothetical protein
MLGNAYEKSLEMNFFFAAPIGKFDISLKNCF